MTVPLLILSKPLKRHEEKNKSKIRSYPLTSWVNSSALLHLFQVIYLYVGVPNLLWSTSEFEKASISCQNYRIHPLIFQPRYSSYYFLVVISNHMARSSGTANQYSSIEFIDRFTPADDLFQSLLYIKEKYFQQCVTMIATSRLKGLKVPSFLSECLSLYTKLD